MLRKLDIDNSLLLIIDIQEKLVQMLSSSAIVQKVAILTETAKILNIPILVTEQYTKGLGSTVELVKSKLSPETKIVEKNNFSALNVIKNELITYGKKKILLCGIETHICILQTALDLLEEGYEIFIIKDACGARDPEESIVAAERLKQNNATIMTVEMALFELLGSSKHPNFKSIQSLIK